MKLNEKFRYDSLIINYQNCCNNYLIS